MKLHSCPVLLSELLLPNKAIFHLSIYFWDLSETKVKLAVFVSKAIAV